MKKVTDEELLELQNLRDSLFKIISSLGELHLNKLLAKKQLQEIEDMIGQQELKFQEFQQKERSIYDQLQQKYGTGNLDIETGEITE